MSRSLRELAADVRAALPALPDDPMTDEDRAVCARRLRDLLTAEGLDVWQFNDLVWAELRDEYDALELNPTFVEVWA